MNKPTVAVITCWGENTPEYLADWAEATKDADYRYAFHNSDKVPNEIGYFTQGVCIKVKEEYSQFNFAKWNNHGVDIALDRANIDIIVLLNNDVWADTVRNNKSWINSLREDVKDGAIYGREIQTQVIDGIKFDYLSGWCLAMTTNTWRLIGGFDESFESAYWEDVDLCFRAVTEHNVKLIHCPHWGIRHIGNGTSSKTANAYDKVQPNKARFIARFKEAYS